MNLEFELSVAKKVVAVAASQLQEEPPWLTMMTKTSRMPRQACRQAPPFT
jgi:hypothetical protein